MSGFLFLVTVVAFVALAYWAHRNDGMGAGDSGSGILAMITEAPKGKPAPKWKKAAEPKGQEAATPSPAASANPGWKRSLQRGPRA
ncbi:MAG TPA: hypothetical protein VGM68_01445 [Rhizomicrobium sp.]